MISQAILVKLTILGTMMLLITETNSAPTPKAACQTNCGNVTIPFPFGTSFGCNLDDSFLITCNHSYNPPKPYLNLGGSIEFEVLAISLDGLMKVASSVASDCYDESGSQINGAISELTLSKFPISSTRNKFIAIGCDTYALTDGSDVWKRMSAGCVSWCGSIDSVVTGTCPGIGCCQTSIPKGIRDFLVDIQNFRYHTRIESFNPCVYAFVVETEAFHFSTTDHRDLQNRKTVPVVLDWSVGNMTCLEAQENLSTYACRANHSECSDSSNGIGYNCNCLTGFHGNPYHVDGCEDINECSTLEPCEGKCTNLKGSYLCSCPKGFEGDGKKDGAGCHSKSNTNDSTIFYVASGFLIPAVGSFWIFWWLKQKKEVKLRKNLFCQNGGLELEKILRTFTAEDLKMATDNYNKNNVILEQHSGVIYKGILRDESQQQVMIKTLYEPNNWNVDVFVRKISILSQIEKKNVLRLVGCCLETQVPVLVYKFVGVKSSLVDYIHDDALAISLSWDIRLRIAMEAATTLAYLHHDAAVAALIHGNLNSSSILLDHDYTVKVDDFALFARKGDSCSDVYSFGVVLAELLIGKPLNDERSIRGVKSSLSEDKLNRILDNRLVLGAKSQQLAEVAKLAVRCLSHSSFERPTMKEVAMALESAINLNSSSMTTTGANSSLTTTLLELGPACPVEPFEPGTGSQNRLELTTIVFLKNHSTRWSNRAARRRRPCIAVSDDICEIAKKAVEAIGGGSRKRNEMPTLGGRDMNSASSHVTQLHPPVKGGSLKQKTIFAITRKNEKENADEALVKAMIVNNIPFNVLRSEEFVAACTKIAAHGKGYVPPSSETARTKYLAKLKEEANEYVNSVKSSWVESGCTLMSDIWTDRRKRPHINLLVACPKGITFLKSECIVGSRKTAEYISKFISSGIEEIGPSNVVQFVSNNASNYIAAGYMIEQKYPHIVKTSCAAHYLDLALEDIDELSCKIDF
ncbi:hypothetical protein BUALT_Bualt08G0112700 [Buddleja alternifolia]|uniref:Uncharacterized protein n=1 Tax=Buddleja alternifolia TaxID=168488 RepID=A0AAV6XCJ9_9LAMI|nr:hypothetical protein BUALT_Bualt08G0112700 [Buddleja alternifolia]